MKRRTITTEADADEIEALAKVSATKAIAQVCALPSVDPLGALWRMKTTALGCDPLDAERPLNLIEQINQTFTYIASARAARTLLTRHPELAPFHLNLGTESGSDIESVASGGLSAEVFAAVTPSNNKKLQQDIMKVSIATGAVKYVFFMCPGEAPGERPDLAAAGVTVWSLDSVL